jgi:hypothetical protein
LVLKQLPTLRQVPRSYIEHQQELGVGIAVVGLEDVDIGKHPLIAKSYLATNT